MPAISEVSHPNTSRDMDPHSFGERWEPALSWSRIAWKLRLGRKCCQALRTRDVRALGALTPLSRESTMPAFSFRAAMCPDGKRGGKCAAPRGLRHGPPTHDGRLEGEHMASQKLVRCEIRRRGSSGPTSPRFIPLE